MHIYADTSFLVALYSPEADSLKALKWMQSARHPLPYTPLHRLELRTAIRMRVFRGQITPDQRKQAFVEVESDLSGGILAHMTVPWADAFQKAENLAAAHVETTGIRSMDLLHVAVAQALKARTFLTLELKQRTFAAGAGLQTRF
jgi:predicted nucleic acid-binding protein